MPANHGTIRTVCSSYDERRNTVRGGVRAASQVGMANATTDAPNPSTTPLMSGNAVSVIVRLPGVERIRRYRSIMLPTERTPVLQIALDVAPADHETFLWAAGNPAQIWPAFYRDAIIISEPLALRRQLQVGDTFTIQTDRGDVAMPIAGIFYDYGTELGVVMMPLERYQYYFADQQLSSLGIYVADGVDSEQMVETIRTQFPDVAYRIGGDS